MSSGTAAEEVAVTGATRWAHESGASTGSCGRAGHGGGVCGRWFEVRAVVVGTGYNGLGSVGVGEEL